MGTEAVKTVDSAIWSLLRKEYGKDLKSAFVLVTTMRGNELRQASILVYPPDGKAMPTASHGGWNGGKYSVRRDLLADLEAAEAAQQAEKAEKAARMAASPFAALAALKGKS